MRNNYRCKGISLTVAALMFTGIFTGCANSDELYSPQTFNDFRVVGEQDQFDGAATAPQNTETASEYYYQTTKNNNDIQNGLDENYPSPDVFPTADDCTANVEGFTDSDDSYYNYFNTEEYNTIIDNGYKAVKQNPLSTFSIDVDTASYANLRRQIEANGYINPESIRIEEMINYFNYNYANPKGADPFSVTTELADCPWNDESKLMLIGLKAEDIDTEERVPMNLVFLIDVSGSMYSDDKLPLVQQAFTMLADNLNKDDRISIVTYAGAEQVVLAGEKGSNKQKIVDAINSLSAGGSTAGEAGIKRAYKLAEKNFIKGGNNRIILATDGDLNVGVSTEDGLKKLVEEKRESGVFLSVLGFGTGNIKDNKMETLADNGNGNYSYIDSVKEAKKVLVEEMTGTLFTVAKDVKIQVEFNPENVLGYRLIGYENRSLADKDFADDTKDAGEIGAGHTVTALYEVMLADVDTDPIELKYQATPKAVDPNAEICTVSLRYKKPDGDTSKLISYPITIGSYQSKMPDNIKFASSVAMFGMTLRNSEYKGTASCTKILEMLESYDYRNDEYKDEFAYLVRTMKREGY